MGFAQSSRARVMAQRYALFGQDVPLRNPKTGADVTLRLIDMTAATQIGQGIVDMDTISPKASVRMAELSSNDIDVHDLMEQTITLSGAQWHIRSHAALPGPFGEDQVMLLLGECNA